MSKPKTVYIVQYTYQDSDLRGFDPTTSILAVFAKRPSKKKIDKLIRDLVKVRVTECWSIIDEQEVKSVINYELKQYNTEIITAEVE